MSKMHLKHNKPILLITMLGIIIGTVFLMSSTNDLIKLSKEQSLYNQMNLNPCEPHQSETVVEDGKSFTVEYMLWKDMDADGYVVEAVNSTSESPLSNCENVTVIIFPITNGTTNPPISNGTTNPPISNGTTNSSITNSSNHSDTEPFNFDLSIPGYPPVVFNIIFLGVVCLLVKRKKRDS